MTPAPNPPVEELLRWLAGELSADDMAKVDMLVASGDPSVTRTLSWLEWLARDARRAESDAPPPDLHTRLVDLFAQRRVLSGSSDVGQACYGELVFDGRRDQRLVATRGTSAPGSYRLAYASPFGDVVLDVRPEDRESLMIHGQLLTECDLTDLLVVTASGRTEPSVCVAGDGLGRFKLGRFSELPEVIVIKNRELHVIVTIGSVEGR
jgi:hypothetical protein